MKKETFIKTGVALLGPLWQTSLAKALKVNDRTVRRWISGEHPVPDGVSFDLLRLIEERIKTFHGLIQKIQKEQDK